MILGVHESFLGAIFFEIEFRSTEYIQEGVQSEEDVLVEGFELASFVEGIDFLDGIFSVLVVEIHVPVNGFHDFLKFIKFT